MNKPQQQNEDVYDSVFNFIFDIQKKKEPRKLPENTKGLSEYSTALMEVGTQPLVYPIESAFATINKHMSKGLGTDVGGEISGGIGSGMFANPVKYSKSEIAKNRVKANWASVGGGLRRSTDGALLSLYAKSLGMQGKSAYQVGKILQDIMKEEDYARMAANPELLPYRTPTEKKNIQSNFLQEAINLKADILAQEEPSLNRELLSQHMRELQRESSKNERIRRSFELFRQQGLDKEKSLDLAYSIWGDVKTSEKGVYRISRDEWLKNIRELETDKKLTPNQLKKIEGYKKIEDPQKKRREIARFLKKELGLDSKEAFERSKDLASIEVHEGSDIARESMYWALAHQLRKRFEKEGKKVSTREIKRVIEKRLDFDKRATLGMRLERGVLAARWLSNANAWSSVLLNGDWEKFGVEGLNFTNIVELKKAKDEDGNVVGTYFEGADSIIGKLIGDYYYLHPNNMIKGLIGDGSLWLKWATNKDGIVDKRSFAYLMSKMSLQNSLSILAKPMQGLSQNVLKIINPMFDRMKIGIKNLAKKVLGATGLGGVMVNVVMNFVSDKFAYVINQIVIAVILAVVGILFVIFGWMGMLYSDEYTEAMLNSEKSLVQEETNVFTDTDFGSVNED
jgi:hypothetical protein